MYNIPSHVDAAHSRGHWHHLYRCYRQLAVRFSPRFYASTVTSWPSGADDRGRRQKAGSPPGARNSESRPSIGRGWLAASDVVAAGSRQGLPTGKAYRVSVMSHLLATNQPTTCRPNVGHLHGYMTTVCNKARKAKPRWFTKSHRKNRNLPQRPWRIHEMPTIAYPKCEAFCTRKNCGITNELHGILGKLSSNIARSRLKLQQLLDVVASVESIHAKAESNGYKTLRDET